MLLNSLAMSNLNVIIISLALAGIALFTVSFVNAQQTRKRLISQKLSQLKRKLSEMEELTATLENLTGNVAIARTIVEEVIDTLRGMQQLAPDSQSIELNLETNLQRLQDLNSSDYQCHLNRLLESDAAIARAHYMLGEAARIIRKRQDQGLLELAQMTAFIEEMAWAHLMVTVITLTGQGHKAVGRGDVMRAHAFYKKAQEAALQSNSGDQRRHQFIKELSELMSQQRVSISTSLMPETQFNPKIDKAKASRAKMEANQASRTPGTTLDN